MSEKFLKLYFEDFVELAYPDQRLIESLIKVKNVLISAKKNSRKVLIFGNGGSATIASHFSVDLTKNTGLRCINFNEAALITCFSNDYGYERWIEKAIDFYGEQGDVLIVISSSGKSRNILNGCKAAREKNFSSIITFSGFNIDNSLHQLGDVNLWVNSKAYNFVENIHQLWLLSIVDLLIGKREYDAKQISE